MKQKILFVMPSLNAGGGEKALVNLLYTLPESLYEVDVLLFKKEGLFISQLPKHIQIIQPEGSYKIFTSPLVQSLFALFYKGKWKLMYYRILYFLTLRKNQNPAEAEQFAWKYWAKSMSELPKIYDVAIAFLEKSSIYFVVDKVKAQKKIGWIHTLYNKSGMNPKFDVTYFSRLNKLITITEECQKDLEDTFKDAVSVEVIENISSKKLVHELASESVDVQAQNLIVTVGRLSPEKGTDLAVKAASILKKQGLLFTWVFIGEGSLRDKLETTVKDLALEDTVKFIGNQANPYKYVERAQVYCQPSRYEGRSIAIDEAKLLAKPILATNFDTVRDQLEHLQTGFIVDCNEQAIADGVLTLLEDIRLREKLSVNLQNFTIDDRRIIKKFNQLINE